MSSSTSIPSLSSSSSSKKPTTLLSLRVVIADALEMLSAEEAAFWFDWMFSHYGHLTHWSDYYQRAKYYLQKGRAAQCLSLLDQCQAENSMINILRGEALLRAQRYSELAELNVNLILNQSSTLDPSMFPPNWIPLVKDEKRIKARLLCLQGTGRFRMNAEQTDLYADFASTFRQAREVSPRCASACRMLYCEPTAILPPPSRNENDLHDAFKREQELWAMFDGGELGAVMEQVERRWGESPPERIVPVYANCLLFKGEKVKLYNLAQRCVQWCPDAATTWYAVGLHYCGQGREEEMRKYWLKGLSKDEGCVPCWVGLGHSYSQAGDHDLAVNAYMAAAHHYAVGSPWPRLFLASEYVRCRRTHLAEPILKELGVWMGDEPQFLNELAVCMAQLKEYRGALAVVDKALTLPCPDHLRSALIINKLHVLLISLTETDERIGSPMKIIDTAMTCLEEIEKHPSPEDGKSVKRVAKLKAFILELATRLSPNSSSILEKAIKAYQEYVAMEKDRWAVDQLARLKGMRADRHTLNALPTPNRHLRSRNSHVSVDLTQFLPSINLDDGSTKEDDFMELDDDF